MTDYDRQCLAAWFELFQPNTRGHSHAATLIRNLEETKKSIDTLEANAHDENLFAPICDLDGKQLSALHTSAIKATAPVSFFSRFNPFRSKHKRRAAAFLIEHGERESEARLVSLRCALALETELRKLRPKVAGALQELYGIKSPVHTSIATLRFQCAEILTALRAAASAAEAIKAYPRVQDASEVARAGTREAFEALQANFEASLRRHDAVENSRAALASLVKWFQDNWLSECGSRIARDATTDDLVQQVIDALSSTLANSCGVCERIFHALPNMAWNFDTVPAWPGRERNLMAPDFTACRGYGVTEGEDCFWIPCGGFRFYLSRLG